MRVLTSGRPNRATTPINTPPQWIRTFPSICRSRATLSWLLVALVCLIAFSPHIVSALRDEDFWAESGILFYDPDDMLCPPGSAMGTLSVSGSDVTMIGDTLTTTSISDLTNHINGISITALPSKLFSGADNTNNPPGTQLLRDQNLRRVVVYALGTYSPSLTAANIEEVIDLAGSSQVLFVTNYDINDPARFVTNNNLFRQAAQNNPRVAVADWAQTIAATDNPETYIDATSGTTPTEAGAALFATTINTALRQFVSNTPANLSSIPSTTGGDNASILLGFLLDAGYTLHAAGAIGGNLQAESTNINPLRFEAGVGNAQSNAMEGFRAIGPDGQKTFRGGFGIVQWTSAGRVANLQNFADQNNLPVTSLEAQIRFLVVELESYNFPPSVLNAMSFEEATWAIFRRYLTPCSSFCTTTSTCLNHAGGCHNTTSPSNLSDLNPSTTPTAINAFNRRFEFAQQFIGLTPSSLQFGGDNCVGAVSSWSGVGFPHYSQCDSRWGNLRFGAPQNNRTICSSGCGPVSFAMMATALLGREIAPPEVVNLVHHLHVPGAGSSHAITQFLANHYGLQYEHISATHNLSRSNTSRVVEVVNQYLRDGWLIHSTGGSSFGSGAAPYSTGGHYVAIRGVTENGMWLIADSATGRDQNRLWDPREVFAAGMNVGNLRAVRR